MTFPDDASCYVSFPVGRHGREAAVWWRAGSWWALLPGEGRPTEHGSLVDARAALEARLEHLPI